MTEQLHFSLSCIGEGNGNPLQCSCLENPRDRGAQWAAIYGVAQSWTRLKWLSRSSSHFFLYIKYPLYIFSSCVLKSLFYPSFIWYEYFVQSFFFPDFFYVTTLLNLLQYCYWVFFLLLFWPQSMQDLSSLTRGWTHEPTLPSSEGKALITRPPGESLFSLHVPPKFPHRINGVLTGAKTWITNLYPGNLWKFRSPALQM